LSNARREDVAGRFTILEALRAVLAAPGDEHGSQPIISTGTARIIGFVAGRQQRYGSVPVAVLVRYGKKRGEMVPGLSILRIKFKHLLKVPAGGDYITREK
jgi:hypothetical protein